jgi:hypothetical protein
VLPANPWWIAGHQNPAVIGTTGCISAVVRHEQYLMFAATAADLLCVCVCVDLSTCAVLTKECWSKLFVPEDTTKVAHGDVNLDIRDFLAL